MKRNRCNALAVLSLVSAASLARPALAGAGNAPPEGKAAAAAGEAPRQGPAIGAPAPDFTLEGIDGKTVKLSDYKGKTVVLEWFNPGCPFVKFAHGKGPLKELGNKASSSGIVWLAINSSGPGKEGNGKQMNVQVAKEFGMTYPVLLDESGSVGRSYDARTTPHMFVIDAKGNLVYKGGLDNAPFGEVAEGGKVTPYVEDALEALAAGKPVTPSETKSYGCSVKYAK